MRWNHYVPWTFFGTYDSLKPQFSDFASYFTTHFPSCFTFAYLIKLGAYLASIPFDTVHRRMMMTSGEGVKYKSSLDAFAMILKYRGVKSLFKGASAPDPAWIGGCSSCHP